MTLGSKGDRRERVMLGWVSTVWHSVSWPVRYLERTLRARTRSRASERLDTRAGTSVRAADGVRLDQRQHGPRMADGRVETQSGGRGEKAPRQRDSWGR